MISEPTIFQPIILISHPSPVWDGARAICVHETGRLLCITRDPLRAAAGRMIEEGYSLSSVLIIKDAFDLAPDITGSIRDALA
jgi:hypothetical protein